MNVSWIVAGASKRYFLADKARTRSPLILQYIICLSSTSVPALSEDGKPGVMTSDNVMKLLMRVCPQRNWAVVLATNRAGWAYQTAWKLLSQEEEGLEEKVDCYICLQYHMRLPRVRLENP